MKNFELIGTLAVIMLLSGVATLLVSPAVWYFAGLSWFSGAVLLAVLSITASTIVISRVEPDIY
jgi:uncharacterized membrane protein YkgB